MAHCGVLTTKGPCSLLQGLGVRAALLLQDKTQKTQPAGVLCITDLHEPRALLSRFEHV